MKCIPHGEGIILVYAIHVGSCANHAASKTLMGKAFRVGSYWLTTKQYVEMIVKTYEGCQFFAHQQHLPASELQNIPVSWPFVCWELDMIDPFKKAPSRCDHVLVTIDKFSKWIVRANGPASLLS